MAHISGDLGSPGGCSSPGKNSAAGITKSVAFSSPLATNVVIEESEQAGSSDSTQTCNGIASSNRSGTNSFVSTTHHPILRIGNRTKVESIMTPLGSDAATLRRQVESLQLDLEAHMESEQRLQVINQELRDRLEIYMKQNHENVQRAESEFNMLHEDMEQTLELQRRLAQRSASLEKEKKELEHALKTKLQEFEDERSVLQDQVTKMSEDLQARMNIQAKVEALQAELEATLTAKEKLDTELQHSMEEVELLRYRVDELNLDLSKLIAKEKRDQMLESSHKKCLLGRFFRALVQAVGNQRILDSQRDSAIAFARSYCCKRGLQSFRTAVLRSKQLRAGYRRHAQACLENCFRAWKLYHIAKRKYEQAALRRQKARVRRMYSNWWDTVQESKMSEGEESRLIAKSNRYWSMTLKRRVWKHWIRWIRYWVKPLREKLKTVKNHLQMLLYRQVMLSWKYMVRKRRMKQFRLAQAYNHLRMWCQKQAFHRWRENVILKLSEASMELKSLQFRRSQLYNKAFKSWLAYVRHKQNKHLLKALAFRHHLSVLQIKGFESWKCGVKQLLAEARALQEVNRALTKAAMLLWHDHHALVSKKKYKMKIADVFKERHLHKVAKQALQCWWEEMMWRRTASHFVGFMASQRRHNLLHNSFYCWMHFTFDSLLLANAKIQTELLDAKAEYEKQKSQTTAVDVENLQLIDRLHAMSSEIAHLKIAISEKERQEEDLHRSLEDTGIIESSMRAELEQQHLHIEELELETIRLQKKLQLQNTEDSVGEVQHAMVIDSLESTMKDLHAQIAEKSSQINSYAKALKDTADRLEGTSDESQEQLSNAFEIAASLRKILEDRENQFATLEGNCRRKELELGEIKKKLDIANSTVSETVEKRDAKIRELETRLAQKQNEVQDVIQEMQDLQIALDAKESLVQRLEYDMKLKSDRDSTRTKTYVSSLSSWSSSASQLDAMSGLRNSTHSIQLESMKHVYMQTKAALQQGVSPDHCLSGYRLSTFKVHSKSPSDDWRVKDSLSQQDMKSGYLSSCHFVKDSSQTQGLTVFEEKETEPVPCEHGNKHGDNEIECTQTAISPQTQDSMSHLGSSDESGKLNLTKTGQKNRIFPTIRSDGNNVVTSSPATVNMKMQNGLSLYNDKQSKSELSQSANVKIFLEPVDTLHMEIQQLQARILERIKTSSKMNVVHLFLVLGLKSNNNVSSNLTSNSLHDARIRKAEQQQPIITYVLQI